MTEVTIQTLTYAQALVVPQPRCDVDIITPNYLVQGFQGAQGAQGPQGGYDVVPGPQGYQGAQGAQGYQGAQGAQGYQGAQGSQGYQGAQGSQGYQGAQGSQGYQGAQGSQGYQGGFNATFTPGSVLFAGATGVPTEDNASLFFDDTNNRLGVGTGATVSAKVHALATTEQLRLGYDTSNYWSATVGSTGGLTLAGVGTGANLVVTPVTGGSATINGSLSVPGDTLVVPTSGITDTSVLSTVTNCVLDTDRNTSGVQYLSSFYQYLSISGLATDLSTFSPILQSSVLSYTANAPLPALTGIAFSIQSTTSGTIGSIDGIAATARIRGAGNVGSATGVGFTVIAGNGYSGTIAAAYGANLKYSCTSAAAKTTNLYLSNAAVTSNSGTITNTYGYYCGDITAGTQTNTPYSFYALDSGAYNYFAGKTAIGTITTPSAYIHSTGSTEQLRIGYDVSNYWSATVSSAGVLALTGTGTGMTLGKLLAAPAAAPTVASGSTIAPTTQIAFVSGTTTIGTITAPAPISAGGGQITLIPTGLWSTSTSGNIALATTAVISKALIMTYDSTTTKWYPSY